MLAAMPRPLPCLLRLLPVLWLACIVPAQARSANAHIDKVTTAVVTLEDVQLRLEWPVGATQGRLQLRAARVWAPDLGYRFRDLDWQCPLLRDGNDGWRCDGELRAVGGKPMRLTVDLATARTDATLTQGRSRVALHRQAATPDDTVLDLTRVPLAWVQALTAQAWVDGRFQGGTLDGRLIVNAPARPPLRVSGNLALADTALETPDASIATAKLGGRLHIDWRKFPQSTLVGVDGELRGGEVLFGGTYLALPATPIVLQVAGIQRGAEGWLFPALNWRDGDTLMVAGSGALSPQLEIQQLQLDVHSADLSALPARYLSGQLGVAGLAGLQMTGGADLRIEMRAGQLAQADADLHAVVLNLPGKGLAFDGLDGDVRLSDAAPVESNLRWHSGKVAGIDFGAASLPLRSERGELRAREPVVIPILGGSLRLDPLTIRPPAGDAGLRVGFGLDMAGLDIGKLSTSLGGPAFRGTLGGTIPAARYANDRIDFDGGLTMRVFDGSVAVSSLSMERPFGVAPTLSADFALHDLDLLALTGVFDFGHISGRLEGRIDALRLVDWTPTAFDAELHTVARRGVLQRISQRAVQNISSVGDASFISSLQGRLIGLFDDFGYARIGISCHLSNEVCEMGGLRPVGTGFLIVDGSGIPRLSVVGYNRKVDWATLVERVAAIGSGNVKPVVK